VITELREDDFPEIYERFVKLLNGKPWIKATQNLEYQLRDNPFTRPQIERDNREAFGLAFFEKYGMRRPWDPAWSRVQEAMNFAAQICDMVERSLDDRGANAYLGRVVGAFKNALPGSLCGGKKAPPRHASLAPRAPSCSSFLFPGSSNHMAR